MLTGAMVPDLAKYRMHIFKPGLKPGHPTPLSWRRRDIYASDDATANLRTRLCIAPRISEDFDEFLPFRERWKNDLRVREKGPH